MNDQTAGPAPSGPPAPRLRAGHLLSGDVEILSLLSSDGGKNIYLAQKEGAFFHILEWHAAEGEPKAIPDSCSPLFPRIEASLQVGERRYLLYEALTGRTLAETTLACWEPSIIALICGLIAAWELLDREGFALDRLALGDLRLADLRPYFLTVPLVKSGDNRLEEHVLAFVVDLVYKRLRPKITRNLAQPLRCLYLSRQLSSVLSEFLERKIGLLQLGSRLAEMNRPSPADWDIHGATHEGMIRDHNEDAVGWIAGSVNTSRGHRACSLLAVADGMGGHLRGDLASHFALNHWLCGATGQSLTAANLVLENPALNQIVAAEFDASQAAFLNEEEIGSATAGFTDRPGATLVAGLLVDRLLFIGNCGDSRAYCAGAFAMERLTRDHSLVQIYVDQGQLREDEAFGHKHGNVITSFMGIEPRNFRRDLFVDRCEPGSRILLCSDGLTDMLPEAEIHKILMEAGSAREACLQLIHAANQAGGRDNISVVAAFDRAPDQPWDETSSLITAKIPVFRDEEGEQGAQHE